MVDRGISLLIVDIDTSPGGDDSDKEQTREQSEEGDFILLLTKLATLSDSHEPTYTII